ncbi:S9 family peptidase [Oleiagrimonas sp. C23AA]|uniref:S9 family peptidase n=1 Tax=Oleiagrimonas sp. C23AA TaxID=2719047 RepID=UPI001422F096|nr:S9 family peptidase [Oleiagrimonas sp. C23AA]NII12183.1 S9 family peptidase [Oleiagrimonas sp. C23AA]
MKSRLRLSALGAAGLLAALGATASQAADTHAASPATKHRITDIIHTLGKAKRFGAVAVSPDGQQVAWVLYGKHGGQLSVAHADGSHERTITIADADKHCGSGDPRWSPDGAKLAFLSSCKSGKDSSQNDIFMVDANGTAAHQVSHLKGFVHDLQWRPDGKALSFLYVAGDTHQVGATSAIKPRTGVIGKTDIEHQQVAMVPAAGGKVSEISPKDLFAYEYSWSADAKRITYTGAPPPGRNNWWVAKLYAQTVGAKPVMVLDPGKVSGAMHGLQIAMPRFSPDGSHIALISGLMSDQGVTGGDIYLVPSQGGTPVNVTPGITVTPSWMTWTGSQSLLVSSFKGGSAQIASFTLHGDKPSTQKALFTVDSSISDGSAMSAISVDAKHNQVAFLHSTFTQAPEVYAARLRTDGGAIAGVARQPHAITHINDGIKPMWGKQESISWTNEGFHVQGWLLFPKNYDPHKKYPMIVYVHGGPAYATRPGWPGVGYGPAPLAAMGYFVLMPNPRGSYGQGEKFTQANRRDFGYGDLRDILAGVDAVEAKYPIDDKRLGLTGWSYGGFMSMFAPTQTQRFAAVVAGAGLSNWQSYYGENSIDQWMIPFFGASVYDDPKVYAKSSAINFIKHAKTPTLIVVGQLDGETPAPQSFEYWHGLRAMGTPTELVVYPGEGHGFHKASDRRDVLERALGWFGDYLGVHH